MSQLHPPQRSATAANSGRATRARRYPITLGSRRQQRRDTRTAWARQRAGLPAEPGIITAEWPYAGTG